jgi:chromosome segregation ATPase
MQSYIAALRSQINAVLQQRDQAQKDAEMLRVRAQRAELALARELRKTRGLSQRVQTLEEALTAHGAPLPKHDDAVLPTPQ